MRKLLGSLSIRQRVTIGLVAVAVAAGMYSLVEWKNEADFKPLFTGLAPDDAAGIVQKLKEGGAEYRLAEGGGSVLVPSSRLNDMRLVMAAAGLPKTGRIGFELFDKANLGATEFTEHVNYRRALEGELERTVMSLAEVEMARVHLTFPKESVFLESQQPAKASVLVRLRPGKRLAQQNVIAIDHLVASAVEGLSPDAVSVLDMNGNLLGRPRPTGGLDGPEPSGAALDYRHQIESDLVAKISSTLTPLVGAEKFRAGASVECDFMDGEQSDEIFDPARSVMLTAQRTEDATGAATAAGVPGTSSTLPRPASRPASGSNRVTRTTENITYQTSRTVKKTRMPAGSVRKISAVVLLDQDVNWEKNGTGYRRILVPPTPEKLKVIHDLVAGVTGFNQERGDQLTIETLPFETTLMTEPPGAPGPPPKPPAPAPTGTFSISAKPLLVVAAAIGGVLVLLGLWFVASRFRLRERTLAPAAPAEIAAPTQPGETPEGTHAASLERRLETQIAEREALQQKLDEQALAALKLAPVITKKAEVFAKHLREKIAKEPEISVQILRTWIREDDN